MASIHGPGFSLCGIPDGHGEATVNGRRWCWDFVDSAGGGPLFVRADNGEPLKNQNPPGAVWDAFQTWLEGWGAGGLAAPSLRRALGFEVDDGE